MVNYECKVESKGSISRELTISVKPDSIRAYIDQQLESLQKTVKIKGFREGKVPLDLVKRHYMAEVKSDVFSKVVRDSYIKALEDNKIHAVGAPQIETTSGADLKDGEPLTFTAKIEVYPEIKVKDLSKIKIKRKPTEVSDEDIEKSLKTIREAHAEIVPDEERADGAKTGDLVSISFSGTVGGEALDVLKGDNRLVEIGSRNFMDEFEDGLLGMKRGETRAFTVSFPEDFQEPKLAGKKAEFTATLHEFKAKRIPELDDEFAKRFKLETSLELRKKVSETLHEDRERESREGLRQGVMTALCEANPIDVPKGLVQSQLEFLMKENAEYLKKQGFTEKMIRDYFEKNLEALVKRAEEQVRGSLLLDRIAEEQAIRVERQDLEHEYSKIASRIKLPPEQIRELYEKDEHALRQLRFRIKEDRAVEYVLGQARVEG